MNSVIAFSCLLAAAKASPQHLAGHVFTPTITQQYHAQDELGQYTYGYSGGPSAKEETRTVDGVTRGSYSYIDGQGLVQSASYVSDPVNGFRVAATNLPVAPAAPAAAIAPAPAPAYAPIPVHIADSPEVAAAKAAHFAAHHEAIARLGRKKRSLAFAPAVPYGIIPAAAGRFAYSAVAAHPTHPYAYAAPLHSHVLAPAPTPVVATQSQYHAQDELGQYSYGYSDGLSAKQETRRADGITTGGYSYLDANGIVQNVNYVADAAGFRVAASNLPVGPA